MTTNSAVLAETGDSWFNGQKLRLPQGVQYEFQVGAISDACSSDTCTRAHVPACLYGVERGGAQHEFQERATFHARPISRCC